MKIGKKRKEKKEGKKEEKMRKGRTIGREKKERDVKS